MSLISQQTIRELKAASELDFVAKRALYPLLTAAFSLLQILIPPRRHRVCYMSRPDYTDNAYYMYQYLLGSQQPLEHIWIVQSRDIRERIEAAFGRRALPHHQLKVLVRRSPMAIWHCLRSRVVMHTHGTFGFYRWVWRRQVVCLWHGMPIKCVGSLNKVTPNQFPTYGTHHLASSAFFQHVIANAFRIPPDRVLACGLPRCDVLGGRMPSSLSCAEAKHALGLAPDSSLILWMPTYRTELHGPGTDRPRSFLDDLPDSMLDALEQQCQKHGAEVVIKLHPYDLLNHSRHTLPHARIHLLKSVQFERLGIPVYDLLSLSDGLMSDISSVVIDYLETSRPIAIVGFDPATYTRDVVFPPEDLLSCQNIVRIEKTEEWPAFFQRMGSTTSNAGRDAARIFSAPRTLPAAAVIAQACGLQGRVEPA